MIPARRLWENQTAAKRINDNAIFQAAQQERVSLYELFGVGVIFLGALLGLVGTLWLIRNAYRARRWLGVLLALTIFMGTPLVYGLIRFRQNKRPLMLVLAGVIIGAIPFAAEHAFEFVFGLGERERFIDGERHLTLTGWDRTDYFTILSLKKDVVVLELGNSDVTDQTLTPLSEMPWLKELTLNDTMVTDSGLEMLRTLPALERLRLARTKVTKDGIAAFLAAPPPKLLDIDVSGNSIPASALRKWKNVDPEHRRYVN